MRVADIGQSSFGKFVAKHRGIVLPVFAMSMVLAILIPLPTWLMDFMLLVNITLSAIIALTVMYMTGPLQFTSFPTLLLGMTLFRLVLNTGTTRLILTNAGTGGSGAAGRHVVAARTKLLLGRRHEPRGRGDSS